MSRKKSQPVKMPDRQMAETPDPIAPPAPQPEALIPLADMLASGWVRDNFAQLVQNLTVIKYESNELTRLQAVALVAVHKMLEAQRLAADQTEVMKDTLFKLQVLRAEADAHRDRLNRGVPHGKRKSRK